MGQKVIVWTESTSWDLLIQTELFVENFFCSIVLIVSLSLSYFSGLGRRRKRRGEIGVRGKRRYDNLSDFLRGYKGKKDKRGDYRRVSLCVGLTSENHWWNLSICEVVHFYILDINRYRRD